MTVLKYKLHYDCAYELNTWHSFGVGIRTTENRDINYCFAIYIYDNYLLSDTWIKYIYSVSLSI